MTDQERQGYLDAWSVPGALTGMLNWYRASPVYVPAPAEDVSGKRNPFDDPEKLRVRPRHLLIWGTKDKALQPSTYARLEEFCDNLTIVEIPDSDHWVVNAKPELVCEAIATFIDQTVGDGR